MQRAQETGQDSKDGLQPTQTDTSEPPAKRRRGQNKHRPRPAVVDFSTMLCPSLHDVRDNEGDCAPCLYGDKCRYMHDTSAFMRSKLPDIGEKCHVFDTFGLCPYGTACRFASSHLTGNFLNVVREVGGERSSLEETVCNKLSKELQFSLRKRRVKFDRAESYLGRVGGKGKADTEKSKPGTAAVEDTEVGVVSTSDEVVTTAKSNIPVGEVSQGSGPCESNGSDGVVGVVMGGVCDNNAMLDLGPGSALADVEEGGAATACDMESKGAVTDVGVVKLRAREKKKLDFRGKLYLAPLTTVSFFLTRVF